MQEVMSEYAVPLMVVLLAIILFTVFWSFRERLRFWWLDAWYAFPFIGKLNSLSSDTTQSTKSGWLIAEDTLCADYKQHINPLNETEFHKRTEYMRKSHDIGRSPMSGGMFFALGVLLAAEALGFSYLLGVWMAQEGSANLHTVMSFAISFVVATILAILTHNAGHQLYTRRLISSCEKEWRDMGQKTELVNGAVKLDADQSVDDDKPTYTQTIARTGRDKGVGWIVAAIAAVSLICLGSTYMRMQNLRANMIQETVASSEASSNPFAGGSALPDDITRPQEVADNKAKVEKMEAERSEGYAAFVMLGAIFVFTQIVGAFTGFKYGFASREGTAAYNSTMGRTTFEDYMAIFEPRVHKAQSRLRNLQQLIAQRSESRAVHTKGDFVEYLARIREEQSRLRRSGMAATQDLSPPVTPQTQAQQPQVPAAMLVVAPEPLVNQSLLGVDLQATLAHINALATAEDKRAFTLSLQEPLRSDVIAEVKRMKQDDEVHAAAAVKDLF